MDPTPLENRLRKNFRHFRRWAERQGLTAYRVYDRDIPEYPLAIDSYAGQVHVIEYPRPRQLREQRTESLREATLTAIQSVMGVTPTQIHVKTHAPKKWGQEQYERQARTGRRIEVTENGLRFLVNLSDYLDTGLFMDHRNTRSLIRQEAGDKHFLNLFAYTGSFTVYAAAGRAKTTTTVDLSGRYLDWAKDNLSLNGFDPEDRRHRFVQGDVLAWVHEAAARPQRYGLIMLDPPSFSTSKRMSRPFDVQRDHPALLSSVVDLLDESGTLYFSTNYQGFRLSPPDVELEIEELTPKSIPSDFRFKGIHRCWRLRRR